MITVIFMLIGLVCDSEKSWQSFKSWSKSWFFRSLKRW